MKKVLKLTPVSLYDVRGVESWLEDMARRGLFVTSLRPLFSTFAREPSRSIRYRVEPFRRAAGGEAPQDMLDLYQEFGWTLVCQPQDLLVFSNPDPAAPELHSDPELQGELWRKLYRSKRRNFFWNILFVLCVAFYMIWVFFSKGAPVCNLIATPILWVTLIFGFVLAENVRTWGDIQRLGLIVRQLEAGVPLEHRSFYPRRQLGGLLTTGTTVVLLVSMIVSQFVFPLFDGDIQPLDSLTAFRPLALAQVEGEGYELEHYVFDRYPSLDPDGEVRIKDYGNFCERAYYPLCWNRWRVVQTGRIQPEDWRRMEIEWFDLPDWLSFLSVPLARELLDGATALDQDIWWTDNSQAVWTVNYYPYEGTSFLAVARRSDGQFHIAAAANRDKAVLVRYTGQGNLEDYLEEIAEMVQ